MVIRDADFGRPLIGPTEDDAPLLVDPNGMKSGEVAFQCLEAIAGWNAQIVESSGPVHLNEFPQGNSGNGVETPISLFVEELLRVGISEGLDHEISSNEHY